MAGDDHAADDPLNVEQIAKTAANKKRRHKKQTTYFSNDDSSDAGSWFSGYVRSDSPDSNDAPDNSNYADEDSALIRSSSEDTN